jgi:hypothetical protein
VEKTCKASDRANTGENESLAADGAPEVPNKGPVRPPAPRRGAERPEGGLPHKHSLFRGNVRRSDCQSSRSPGTIRQALINCAARSLDLYLDLANYKLCGAMRQEARRPHWRLEARRLVSASAVA